MSLLDDCQNCLLKGHESWKSYFSKWELLAKEEENIPEEDLIEDFTGNLDIQEQKTQSPKKLVVTKRDRKNAKNTKRIIKKKNTVAKKKRTMEVIKMPTSMGNENRLKDSGNEQLELNLRAIFMDILKANKNKWEIFSVLSQTFSQEKVTIKGSHHLVLNQQLALSFNDVKMDKTNSTPGNQVFSSALSKINQSIFEPTNLAFNTSGIGFNGQSGFSSENSTRYQFLMTNQIVNPTVPTDQFSFNKMQSLSRIQTPQITSKIGFTFRNRLVKSCPSKIFSHSYLNNFSNNRNKVLKPLALDFGNKYLTNESISVDKIFSKSSFKQLYFERAPMNICEEKSFQNLSSYKRTNNMSLNMENSNFITPKRKASERKCFSENILQRKRKRPSKLPFFDNEEDSESDDDRSVNRSPIILWENKRRKTEIIPEVEGEYDSDCEKILDRVIKP